MLAKLWVLQHEKTPLMHASNAGNLDVVKYLVEECKVAVNATDKVKQHTHSNRLARSFCSRAVMCCRIRKPH